MNIDDSSEGMWSSHEWMWGQNLLNNNSFWSPILLAQDGIPDLLEPLQKQESNLSSLISLASVLLSSPPLLPPFIHPSPSHLCTLSSCRMPEKKRAAMWIKGRTIAKSAPGKFYTQNRQLQGSLFIVSSVFWLDDGSCSVLLTLKIDSDLF